MSADFDELNIVQKKSMPYEEYFSGMDLTEEQKKERIRFSHEFEDVVLFIFSLVSVMISYDYINTEYIKSELEKRYSETIRHYVNADDYVDEYIRLFSDELVDTTLKHKDDEWFLSGDRAMLTAENEANTILNHSDFANAVQSGKTKKKWIDVRDRRERKSHLKVGGTVKPILEPFLVGDSLMLYPKDETYSPSMEQTANCRCSIEYY